MFRDLGSSSQEPDAGVFAFTLSAIKGAVAEGRAHALSTPSGVSLQPFGSREPGGSLRATRFVTFGPSGAHGCIGVFDIGAHWIRLRGSPVTSAKRRDFHCLVLPLLRGVGSRGRQLSRNLGKRSPLVTRVGLAVQTTRSATSRGVRGNVLLVHGTTKLDET